MPVVRYNLRSRAMPNAARINRAQLFTTRVVAYPGAYALTGTDVDLNLGEDLILTAEAGAISLSGQDASVLLSRVLAGGAGSYALTGQDAGLGIFLDLTAEAGSYALGGQDGSLIVSRVVVGAAGSFDLTGTDASFLLGKYISAAGGAIDLTGQTASLLLSQVLAAGAGSFDLSGVDASLLVGRSLVAGAGAFSISGQAATLSRQLPLAAGAGSFTLSGQAATLTQRFAPSITLVSNNATLENDTSGSWASQSLGAEPAAGEKRYMILVSMLLTTTGSGGISAPSVGGVSLTEVHEVSNGQTTVSISVGEVPTGTTGEVEFTSSVNGNHAFALYRAIDIDPTVFDTGGAGGTSDPLASTIDVPAYGLVVAGSQNRNKQNVTMTGVTEDVDLDYVSNDHYAAGHYVAGSSAETARSVSFDWSAAGNEAALCIASFGPRVA